MPRGHHDVGGLPGAGPIDQSQHELSDWEILADAINQALGAKGVKRTDEMRRAREEMDSAAYRDMSYYERWIASIEAILIEKKILEKQQIDRKLAEFDTKWGRPRTSRPASSKRVIGSKSNSRTGLGTCARPGIFAAKPVGSNAFTVIFSIRSRSRLVATACLKGRFTWSLFVTPTYSENRRTLATKFWWTFTIIC